MGIKNYRWLIFSEEDVKFYKRAFERTPNLCYEEAKKNNDKLEWKLDDLPMLMHKTNNGDFSIKPYFVTVNLNDSFAEVLTNYCLKANTVAAEKTGKKIKYHEKNPGEAKATIYSLVHKWSYEGKLCFIDMASDLLFDIAVKHKFSDGNKRTALLTTLYFLQLCGLYVLKPMEDDFWDEFLPKIIEDHEKGYSEEDQKTEIKNILLSNIALSYKWV